MGVEKIILDIRDKRLLSYVLKTAVDIDLFEVVGNDNLTLEDINGRYNYDKPMLEAFLDTLCATGFLEKDGSKYSIPENERRFLLKGNEDYKLGVVGVTFTYDRLTHLKERLESKDNIFEPSPEEWQAITNATKRFVNPFMGLVKDGKIGNIKGAWIDVGTGQGSYLLALAAYETDFKGLGLDTCYEVVQSARENSKDYVGEDLSDRVRFSTEDFMQIDGIDYDTVMFNHLFHGVGEEIAKKYLKKAAEFADRIIVQEIYKDGYEEAVPYLADINFRLSLPNGKVFSKDEVENMIKDSGYEGIKSIHLPTDSAGFYITIANKNQ